MKAPIVIVFLLSTFSHFVFATPDDVRLLDAVRTGSYADVARVVHGENAKFTSTGIFDAVLSAMNLADYNKAAEIWGRGHLKQQNSVRQGFLSPIADGDFDSLVAHLSGHGSSAEEMTFTVAFGYALHSNQYGMGIAIAAYSVIAGKSVRLNDDLRNRMSFASAPRILMEALEERDGVARLARPQLSQILEAAKLIHETPPKREAVIALVPVDDVPAAVVEPQPRTLSDQSGQLPGNPLPMAETCRLPPSAEISQRIEESKAKSPDIAKMPELEPHSEECCCSCCLCACCPTCITDACLSFQRGVRNLLKSLGVR